MPLLKRLAADGLKLPGILAEVRAAAKEARVAEIVRLRAEGPECPHRVPGGASPHPGNGQPLCPECRTGVPAPDGDTGPDPQAEYVRAYLAAHGSEMPWDLQTEVIRQINHMRKQGAPEHHIVDLAVAAAKAKTDLRNYPGRTANAS
jgi:hypothetical protein